MQGGVGAVATLAFAAMDDDLDQTAGFWDTAKYLIATYGVYEAYQLVRFNYDYYLAGYGHFPMLDGERLRPNSRMLLGVNYFGENPNPPEFPGPYALSGRDELRALMAVMVGALLFQRLGLRREINRAPLTALGLYRLSQELPVSRNRR